RWLELRPRHVNPPRSEALPVVGELKRNRDVFRFSQRFDYELECVLVLADDPKLVALDAHLDLRRHSLDALSQVARDVVGDPRIQLNLDLAATLSDRFRIAGLEELGRELPACALL